MKKVRWCAKCGKHVLSTRRVKIVDIIRGRQVFECTICGSVVGRKPSNNPVFGKE